MPHVVRRLPWGTIDIVMHEGRVFFQERWKYEWTNDPGTPAWTLEEKRRFHRSIDRQIWRQWSNRVRFRTSGRATFAARHRTVPINFDARWVTTDPRWTVRVRKLPAGSTPTTVISNVDRANMQINLDSADLDAYQACTNDHPQQCQSFRAVPHEFGHTFPGVNDEYSAGHAHLHDVNSIMNIGSEIRTRHLQPILDELNTMIPDCNFRHP